MSDYYLPRETGNLVDASIQYCRNLGLILDKYPTQLAVQKSEGKSAWFKEMKPDSHIDEQLAEQVYARWLRAIEAMGADHFDARTDWRMVVGLGGETVLETDLTLHHVYGIPYIPGSALKGLTRAYVTGEVEGYRSKKLEEDGSDVQRIFGTQKDAGSVIFFDAMPVKAEFEVSLDIMNPHYPDYYGDKKPPTNNQNLNPITFLTITNATFTFALALRRGDEAKDDEKGDVGKVKGWLQQALRNYGVGGKTSAGYGSLTILGEKADTQFTQQQQSKAKPAPTPPSNPELNIIAGYIRDLGYLGNKDIPGRIHGFYQRWQKLTSHEARVTLAREIVQKAKQGIKEKDLVGKGWYKEIRDFLDRVNQ